MFSDPRDPFNDSGQLSVDALRQLADQAAAGTTVGAGHIIVHPGGMVVTPPGGSLVVQGEDLDANPVVVDPTTTLTVWSTTEDGAGAHTGLQVLQGDSADEAVLVLTEADGETPGAVTTNHQSWRGTKRLEPNDTDDPNVYVNLVLSNTQDGDASTCVAVYGYGDAGTPTTYQFVVVPGEDNSGAVQLLIATRSTLLATLYLPTLATSPLGSIGMESVGTGLADSYFFARHNGTDYLGQTDSTGATTGGLEFTGGIWTGGTFTGGAATLTVGSSAITGGTSGGVLWDSGGTLACTAAGSTNDVLYWNGTAWAPAGAIGGKSY